MRRLVGVITPVVDEGTPVHRVERYLRDQRQLRALYTDAAGVLHGWYVRRSAQAQVELVRGQRYRVTTTWRCVGYRALFDRDGNSSEVLFDAEIDAIVDAFRPVDALATLPLSRVEIGDGAQLIESGPVTFAGVLSHRAILQIVTNHVVE